MATLEPLIQAVQLLQAGKKTEAEAQALVQTCSALSSQQVGPAGWWVHQTQGKTLTTI